MHKEVVKSPASDHYIYDPRSETTVSGGESTVCHAQSKADAQKMFALKCVEMWDPDHDLDSWQEEFRIMKHCSQHPRIIKLEALHHDAAKGQLQIVMELMEGGTLFDAINSRRKLTGVQTRAVVKNVASALLHMHQLGYVHRNVKPESKACIKIGLLLICEHRYSTTQT